jgi:hypothetical protein
MPQYTYNAVDINGKAVNGVMEATSQNQLLQRVKEKNLYVLSVTDNAEARKQIKIGKTGKIATKTLAVFCRQFSTLINAGISAVQESGYPLSSDRGCNTQGIIGHVSMESEGNRCPLLFASRISLSGVVY